MSDPWCHERCALWRSRGPDFEESFQEGVCGWAGWEIPDFPLPQGSDEMGGLRSPLGQPWNNKAANDIGCEWEGREKKQIKYTLWKEGTFFALHILGCIVSGRKAGADRPWMACRWAGQCWDLGAAAPREASEHPAASAELRAQQELDCMASHVGSRHDWQQLAFLNSSSSWCLLNSCWPVSPLTWARKNPYWHSTSERLLSLMRTAWRPTWRAFWCTG